VRVTIEATDLELSDCCAAEKAIAAVRKAIPDGHDAEEKEESPYALIRWHEADQERRATERIGRMLADVERVLRRRR
jgi:hypothetical protein